MWPELGSWALRGVLHIKFTELVRPVHACLDPAGRAAHRILLAHELTRPAPCSVTLQGALHIGFVAPSLGGVETLVTIPARTSHKVRLCGGGGGWGVGGGEQGACT